MEYFYPEHQWLVVLYFFLVGSVLCLLYDLFRIKREFFGSSRVVLFIDDFLYTLLCTICVILGILKINSGNVRWYELFFALSGFVLYRVTFSRLITGFFFFLSRLVKRFLSALISVVIKILLPFVIPFVKLYQLAKKLNKELSKRILLFKYEILFIRKLCKVSLKTGEA